MTRLASVEVTGQLRKYCLSSKLTNRWGPGKGEFLYKILALLAIDCSRRVYNFRLFSTVLRKVYEETESLVLVLMSWQYSPFGIHEKS